MAESVMDHAQFPTFLDARYGEIVELMASTVQNIIPDIYTQTTSDRLEERTSEIGELDLWPQFTGQLAAQQQTEQYESIFRPREYATMTIITKRLVDDDLSGVFDGVRFGPMVHAGMLTRQYHATQFFEMLNVVDTTWSTYSEGVPFASTAHTTRTAGVSTASGFSNLTTGPLSPLVVRAILIAGRKIKSDIGRRSDLWYDEWAGPVDLVPTMNEILRTVAGLNSPYGNENQESAARSGIQKVIGIPHWSSSTNYVFFNSMLRKQQLRWVEREAPTYGRIVEFDTLQIKNRGYMRHGVQRLGWRMGYAGVVS